MATRTVGPGKQHSSIRAAIAAASAGDVIVVDPGTYTNDGGTIDKNLTITVAGGGANGFFRINGGDVGNSGKAYFVSRANFTLEWCELVNTIQSWNSYDVAGIRWEGGGNLTVNNCYFADNGNGILGANQSSGTPTAAFNVTITNTEFNHNGHPLGGAGTHHIYFNHCNQLTIDNCYFHDITNEYNQVKSRAQRTTVKNSRIFDLNGLSGYSVDCPNGGDVLVQNCVIQQGAQVANNAVLTHGVENGQVYPSNTTFTLDSCTIVNDYASGGRLFFNNGGTFVGTNNRIYNAGGALQLPGGMSGTTILSSRPTLDTSTKPWGGTSGGGTDPDPDPGPGPNPNPTGNTLTVGPGKQFSTIRQAIAAASNDDLILVDGGRTYNNDGGIINKRLTIRAVNGFARISGGGVTNDKGYFVAQQNFTLERFELVGAGTQNDGYWNWAGIRWEGGNLVVNECYFEANGNGIQGSVNTSGTPTASGTVTITKSEFNHNGHPLGGAGTHHIYINQCSQLTIDACYFHDITNDYNQIKSRAQRTTVKNCRIFDLNGFSSYSVDCPDGGVALVENCIIQQGTNQRNPAIFTLGVENGLLYSANSFTVRNCIIINDSGSGIFINRSGTPAVSVENCQVYRLNSSALPMPSGTNVTVSGTTFLSTRPTLDTTTKPWATGGGTDPNPPDPTALTVGPSGRNYTSLSAAIAAAADNAVILVDAGTYLNDFSADGINKRLTIKGVGGFARLVQTAATIPNGKGILVPNQDLTLEWIEFVGAKLNSGDPPNGAGIRHQGGNLTLKNCWFHDCQNGLLANTSAGSIVLEKCEFGGNGGGEGRTHNIYVNNIPLLQATDCYFHEVNNANQIKSRAARTVLTRCRIFDLNAWSNYSIDIPDGGRLEVTDCIIHQGAGDPAGSNGNVIETGAEGGGANGDNVVSISNTTFVNSRAGGATFYWNASSAAATITGARTYADPGTSPITMNSGAATVTGTVVLSTRPTLDTSHPWDSVGFASGRGTATAISDSPAGPGVEPVASSNLLLGNRSNHPLAKPTGTLQGQRMIWAMVAGRMGASAASITPPSGFLPIGTNPHCVMQDEQPYTTALYLFYKDAGASEPTTYTATSVGACDSEAVLVTLKGADTAIAPRVSTDNTGENGTPSIANSVTLTTLNAWVAHVTACWNSASGSTAPTNFTERFEGGALYLADRIVASTGATGTSSANHPNNITDANAFWGAVKIAVEAVGGGQTVVRDTVGSASGRGTATAFGQTVIDTVGAAAGSGSAQGAAPGGAAGFAVGVGKAQAFSSVIAEVVGRATGRGSATAFMDSPGLQSIGLVIPQPGVVGPTLIAHGNWADDAIYMGGAWRNSLPLTNLATAQYGELARTASTDQAATQCIIDIGRNRPARVVGLLNHNLRFAAKYRLRASNSSTFDTVSVDTGWQKVWPTVYPMRERSWGSDNFWFGTYTADDVKGYPWHLIMVLGATKWLRYWHLEIDDPSNPDGFVQAGRLFIGDAWQPTNGVAYGFQIGWEDETPLAKTLSGAKYPDPRPPARVARPTTHFMDTHEAFSKSFEIQRRMGTWREVIYIHDINDTLHSIRRRFPARIRTPGLHENPYPEAHQVAWEFEEILP